MNLNENDSKKHILDIIGKVVNQNEENSKRSKENTASRNINKSLYDNITTNGKITREERFQRFLTKYSKGTITENEDTKTKNTVRSMKAQERCYLLHEKGKIKNEVSSLIFKKNNELRLMKELSE